MGGSLGRQVPCVERQVATTASFGFVSVGMQGERQSMEDSVGVKMERGQGGRCAICVCDGHGGGAASTRVATELPGMLLSSSRPSECVDAVMRLERQLVIDESEVSGTTLSAVLLTPPKASEKQKKKSVTVTVDVINVGDSRIYRLDPKAGTCEALTQDDNPYSNPEERARVLRSGAFVAMGRVNHTLVPTRQTLNLSRALGDAEHKQPYIDAKLPIDVLPITASPHMRRIELEPGQFLLLACDGMFERKYKDSAAALSQQLAAIVSTTTIDSNDVLQIVERFARDMGTKDNLTLAVVWAMGKHEEEEEEVEKEVEKEGEEERREFLPWLYDTDEDFTDVMDYRMCDAVKRLLQTRAGMVDDASLGAFFLAHFGDVPKYPKTLPPILKLDAPTILCGLTSRAPSPPFDDLDASICDGIIAIKDGECVRTDAFGNNALHHLARRGFAPTQRDDYDGTALYRNDAGWLPTMYAIYRKSETIAEWQDLIDDNARDYINGLYDVLTKNLPGFDVYDALANNLPVVNDEHILASNDGYELATGK